jgi:hypothetical protein
MVARLEGARRRLSVEHDGRAWLAWTTEALRRTEKLPDLASLYSNQKTKKGPQTPKEQEISLDLLFLAWGGDPDELAKMREDRG